MSKFQGKKGKDVEIAPWPDDDDEKSEKYMDDPSFRLEVGPNLDLHGECGLEESLFGLQIDLNFGSFGSIRGIVQHGLKKITHDGVKPHTVKVLETHWRCGPNYEDDGDTFVSTHDTDGKDIVAWYYQGRKDTPSWLKEEDRVHKAALDFIQTLASAEEGTRVVNWKEPYCADDVFGQELFRGDANENRWSITLSRLNDPDAAECYGTPSDKPYPVPFLLACYAFSINIDPDTVTDLPIIVTEDKAALYDLVDDMLRRIASISHSRTGYAELIGLERLVKKHKKDFPTMKLMRDAELWKKAYLNAQALMLVLSDDYEEAVGDYQMIDDPERLYKLCVDILTVFIGTMLPGSLRSDECRKQLEKDLEFNARHLKAGSFMSIVTDEEWQNTASGGIVPNLGAWVTFQKCLGEKFSW